MKNKTKIVFGLFAFFVFTFAIVNFANANTYQFVNTSGQIVSVPANTSEEALNLAYNLSLHSGVILVGESTDINNSQDNLEGLHSYQFVNTSGQMSTVRADSPQEALRNAYNLGLHSGVILSI